MTISSPRTKTVTDPKKPDEGEGQPPPDGSQQPQDKDKSKGQTYSDTLSLTAGAAVTLDKTSGTLSSLYGFGYTPAPSVTDIPKLTDIFPFPKLERIEKLVPSSSIDVDTLLAIHMEPDGYIGFVRKPEQPRFYRGKLVTMESVGCIKVSELRQMIPQIAQWLMRDSYFTLNTYKRTAPFKLRRFGDLPGVWRKEHNVKYLTACYADIDVGRDLSDAKHLSQTLTWRDSAAIVGKLMDDGVIPQASILAKSGRGVYAIWLLQDEDDPSRLPLAWPDRREYYKQVNQALQHRLELLSRDAVRLLLPAADSGLPVDPLHDAARVLRVPGSIHTKAPADDRQVAYLFQSDSLGGSWRYTLNYLAEFVGMKALQRGIPVGVRQIVYPDQFPDTKLLPKPRFPRYTQREVTNRGAAPNKVRGMRALAAKRAQDMVTIEAVGGGYKKGRRWRVLSFYGMLLRDSGLGPHEILAAVTTMAANCDPPYPSDPDDESVKELIKHLPTRSKSNERLCRLLGVTPQMAEEYDLLTIVPDEVRDKRKRTPSRVKWESQQRRDIILKWVEGNNGKLPDGGYRTMARIVAAVAAEQNLPLKNVTHETVRKDCIGMGLPVTRRGRPKKAPDLPFTEK